MAHSYSNHWTGSGSGHYADRYSTSSSQIGAAAASRNASSFSSAMNRQPYIDSSLLSHAPIHATSAAAAAAASYAAVPARSSGRPDASATASSSSLQRPEQHFRVGQLLDARDHAGKWLRAQVSDLNNRGAVRMGEWEMSESGEWQPKGGTVLRIHFEGFEERWDEYIHAACFMQDVAASDALGPSLRPRLAPLHSMTPDAKSLRKVARWRVGDTVYVHVWMPVADPADEADPVDPRYGRVAVQRSRRSVPFEPRFKDGWYHATVVTVEGEQVQIKYTPAVKDDNTFRFPVWFHCKMGEVQRRETKEEGQAAVGASGQSQQRTTDRSRAAAAATVAALPSPLSSSVTRSSDDAMSSPSYSTSSVSALAGTGGDGASGVASPLSDMISTLSDRMSHSHLRSTSTSSSSAAASATTAVAPAAAPGAPSRDTAAATAAQSVQAAASSPVQAAPKPSPARNAMEEADGVTEEKARVGKATRVVATGSAAQAMAVFLHELLRRSLHSPLRAAIGLVNLGNTCFLSVGLQVLAGLRPMVQYFVLDRAHEAILRRKKASRCILPPPSMLGYSSYASSLYPNARSTAPPPPTDPLALPHNFGELTNEFALILQQLHSGSASPIYTDQLKRLVVNLPNDAGARFRGMHMQDAHEFLAVLLNALHEELNEALPTVPAAKAKQEVEAAKKAQEDAPPPPFDPVALARKHWNEFCAANNDVLSALFYAQSAQYVICTRCQHASCSHSVLGQLTLDIPHRSGKERPATSSSRIGSLRGPSGGRLSLGGSDGGAAVPLSECLATILASDQLDDYACTRCKRKGPAMTSAYLTSLPALLMVQLKRFLGDAGGGGIGLAGSSYRGGPPAKDETPCSYPEEIDLAPLLQPHDSVVAALLGDGGAPYVFSGEEDGSSGAGLSTRYKLAGVVRHYDEHYTAFSRVRAPSASSGRISASRWTAPEPTTAAAESAEPVWCFFNDSKTYIEPIEDVLAHEEHVYLLVYERI